MAGARIVSDPSVMLGKPLIAGTRITVELILERLAAGETAEQILAEHPHLPADSIRAALAFAAQVLKAANSAPPEGSESVERRTGRPRALGDNRH
jgi:uncharacterized protein (DUF433 family)